MREDVARTLEEVEKGAKIGETAKKYIPNSVSWGRLFTIMQEFRRGFKLLARHDKLAVSFFGSSRSALPIEMYHNATKLASILSRDGFTVMSGGGQGIMGAANKGAHETGGESVGLNIKLPFEQTLNSYTTDSEEFQYFFIRKVMLSFASEAYIFFPGGFGTMDEFFEIVTLIQTKKIQKIPVVLVGKEYWSPLLVWIKEYFVKEYKTIDPEDTEIYHLTDSVEEAHKAVHILLKGLCPDCLADHTVGEECKTK